MLDLRVSIHPGGGDGYTIARVSCVNDGSGDIIEGNYDVEAIYAGKRRVFRIEGHKRDEGALVLIGKVIALLTGGNDAADK